MWSNMPLESGKPEPLDKPTIQNLLHRVKSPKPISRDIEKLAKEELEELKQYGVELKGLFSLLESEPLRIAKDYAEFYIARYEAQGKKLKQENPEYFESLVKRGRYNRDGSLPEKRKEHQLRMGLTQKAFEIFLQQIQIPYISNDPTIDWREKFLYDFKIPFFGEIDIKSCTLDNPVVNINCYEFNRENPDWVVAYQILDMSKPRWLKLLGYVHSSKVREYESVLYEGQRERRRHWKIPAKDFEKSNGSALMVRLMIVGYIIKELESIPEHELITLSRKARFGDNELYEHSEGLAERGAKKLGWEGREGSLERG